MLVDCPMPNGRWGQRRKHGHIVDTLSGCWTWTGCADQKGYGMICVHGRQKRAHRAYYEHFVGPIQEGLQLDHVCRNKLCVNPTHLRTIEASVHGRLHKPASGTCVRGHLMAGRRPNHRRTPYCSECVTLRSRERRARLGADA